MSRILAMLILALTLLLQALPAWASCTTHTIMSGGRIITCTTCCYGSSCMTNCY